jgi:hypothetical protein
MQNAIIYSRVRMPTHVLLYKVNIQCLQICMLYSLAQHSSHTHAHAHTHTPTHARTRTHTHTHTHTRTRTHLETSVFISYYSVCSILVSFCPFILRLTPYHHTERCGWVVNTPASYSGGLGLEYRLGDRQSRLSWFSLVLSGEFRDSTLKSVHDRFLTNPFQFIIHLPAFHSVLYNLSYWKKISLNEL